MLKAHSPHRCDRPTVAAPSDVLGLPIGHALHAQLHNASAVGTPKLTGEPPRVQSSKKVAAHRDEDGNRIEL
jgi:hypothetical protein